MCNILSGQKMSGKSKKAGSRVEGSLINIRYRIHQPPNKQERFSMAATKLREQRLSSHILYV